MGVKALGDPAWPSGYGEFADSSLRPISMSGLAWLLYKREALWKYVYGCSAKLFIKGKECLPGSGFLSSRDMTSAVKSDVTTPPPPKKKECSYYNDNMPKKSTFLLINLFIHSFYLFIHSITHSFIYLFIAATVMIGLK